MTIRLRALLWLIPVGAIGGLAFAWSGLFNVAASSGHWGVTDWFLHFVMQRSVALRAMGVDDPPPLDDPALIRRGAAHYETGCAICHGDPVSARGAVVRAMTPQPPDLARRIGEWDPRELFWIVKHGVKFTGMPAWPVQSRDDEVWSVVAFLLRMPGMTRQAYRRLAFGETDHVEAALLEGALSDRTRPPVEDCVRCHGPDGLGEPSGAFPRLDIQTEEYLQAALESYADGSRESGIMQAAVFARSADELADLARFYARTRALAPSFVDEEEVPVELLARGQELAMQGDREANIAACSGCHGPMPTDPRADFPNLAGQYPSYLRDQLRLFAEQERRGGTRFVDLMDTATHGLSENDIDAVALWYAALEPAVPDRP